MDERVSRLYYHIYAVGTQGTGSNIERKKERKKERKGDEREGRGGVVHTLMVGRREKRSKRGKGEAIRAAKECNSTSADESEDLDSDKEKEKSKQEKEEDTAKEEGDGKPSMRTTLEGDSNKSNMDADLEDNSGRMMIRMSSKDAFEQRNIDSSLVTDPDSLPLVEKEYAVQLPWVFWLILVSMTVYTVVYAYVKGFVITPCDGAWFWVFYWTPVPIYGVGLAAAIFVLRRRQRRRVAAGFPFLDTDLQWDNQYLTVFPSIAILAGAIAAMLGIGGGMINGPLFMVYGLQPRVATSTCAFMILFTAIASVSQYFFGGHLGWQFFLWFLSWGFLSGILGQYGVDLILRRFPRPSVLCFLLGGIVTIAVTAMTVTGTLSIVEDAQAGQHIFQFDTSFFTCNAQ